MRREISLLEIQQGLPGSVPPDTARQDTWQLRRAFPARCAASVLARQSPVEPEITYDEISRASLQGMALLHPDGSIISANAVLSTAFGVVTPQSLCGLKLHQLFTPRPPTTWETLLHACLHGEPGPYRQTLQGTGQDTTTRCLDLRLTRVGRQNTPTLLLTCLDVTAQHQREAQELQQHRLHALGALAGGIAHDFNNLLAAMLGYTELLLDDLPPESLAGHRLQRVLSAGERAKELVRHILHVSCQREQARRPIQLGPLVEEVLKLLRPAFPVTIAIHQYFHSHVGTVLAEPTQMYQVVMNLCINAEYALRTRGGSIDIHLEDVELASQPSGCTDPLAPGPYVCLTVRDTGEGMTPPILAQIFDPFFSTKGPEEGSGMGLTVVRSIVRKHDGAITVTSSPGEGTTFAVYLPRFDTAATLPVALEESVPGGSERILFVDDEDAIARLGCLLLERLGYDVVVSTSSSEALELFRSASPPFDLVITDHTMPLMTGATLAQELRRLRPDLPVILCSGFSHTMNAEKALSLGLDAFLLKPFLHRDLAFSVRRALAAHQPPQP